MPNTVSPCRYDVGHEILDNYRVLSVLRDGTTIQLLRTIDVNRGKYVIKVISKAAHYGIEKIKAEISWFEASSKGDMRYAEFLHSAEDSLYAYLVFHAPRLTLARVLDQERFDMIPKAQVREIMTQIVCAVATLHEDGICHTDLRPDAIEFINPQRSIITVYEDGHFVPKSVLQSTELRILFYGVIGARSSQKPLGTDQYRAPETVYGWNYEKKSDNFSIGCIFFEMFFGKPLFIPCGRSAYWYPYEKTVMFDAVLGPYPRYLMRAVSASYPMSFDAGGMGTAYEGDGVAECVKDFARQSVDLGAQFPTKHDDAREVCHALLSLDPEKRLSLDSVLEYEYFLDWY